MELEGSLNAETASYVYLGRSMNMENNLKEGTDRRLTARLRVPEGSHSPTVGPRAPSPLVRFNCSPCFATQQRRGLTLWLRQRLSEQPTEPWNDVF
ncbi:unnamed protein product [Strongylus vulgaris]|uniref:Uncharacterized protein n=1 Tax=Strongylus vulgaris TaxID=40348 RepID=A0A3P7I0J0_STRVU|nr:unnamed protein product [Strongylus vulgaris]